MKINKEEILLSLKKKQENENERCEINANEFVKDSVIMIENEYYKNFAGLSKKYIEEHFQPYQEDIIYILEKRGYLYGSGEYDNIFGEKDKHPFWKKVLMGLGFIIGLPGALLALPGLLLFFIFEN
jgi:hypothetical protein